MYQGHAQNYLGSHSLPNSSYEILLFKVGETAKQIQNTM